MKNIGFAAAAALALASAPAFAQSASASAAASASGEELMTPSPALTVDMTSGGKEDEAMRACIAKALDECKVPRAPQPKAPRHVRRQKPSAAVAKANAEAKAKDGKDGAPGKDGTNGLNGRDGRNGRDGKDGKDGRDGQDAGNWLSLGFTAGAMYWHSNDGTSYFGAVPALRATFLPADRLTLNVTAGLPLDLSYGRSPVGGMIAGTVGYDVTESVTLEGGGAFIPMRFNDQMYPKMEIWAGLLGGRIDLCEEADVDAYLLLGREHDQDAPAFTIGGFVGLTVHFPE